MSSGVVAVDGTKLSASAGSDSNVDYDRIAREIIAEAIAIDGAEDEQHGDARCDELPAALQTEAGRRESLERELARERSAASAGGDTADVQAAEDAWTGSMSSGSSPGCRVGRVGCAKRAGSSSRSGGWRRADLDGNAN